MLDESRDPCVSSANIQVDCGRKWIVSATVEEAKQRLMHKDVVGTVVHGREGLGCTPRQSWYGANTKQRRQLVEAEVKSMQEEKRVVRAASMKKQGSWLNWESIQAKRTSWKDLMAMEPLQISFRLRSIYDLLPSPSNLCLWNLTDSPNCKLCDKPANLKHILSSCKTSLTGGRYKWRHDKVLYVIAHHLTLALRSKRKSSKKPVLINFIKQGASSGTAETGLLPTANDWELLTDLKTQLKIPEQIAITRKRPDIVLWSQSTKQVVFIELTVPWEEGVDEAYERKLTSYNELVGDCRSNGWKTWCLPVEVGTRGFAAQSLWRCLKILGITGKARAQLIREAERVAESSSRWIFEKRESSWQQSNETDKDQIPPTNTKPSNSKTGQTRARTNKSKKAPKNIFKLQNQVVNHNMLFFFGKNMPFSNHHPCTYEVELPEPYGWKKMHSVEQLYMARKALYFDDHESCLKILNAADARETKHWGSNINLFVSETWQLPKRDVMKECLVRKFTDSEEHLQLSEILTTAPQILIEASPSDTHWGIGFSKEQGPYINQSEWGDGENWLGRLLMSLQKFLLNLASLDPNRENEYDKIYRQVRRKQKFVYDRAHYSTLSRDTGEPFREYMNSML
jgi:ribA/ribD-fused uncharacterized protein